MPESLLEIQEKFARSMLDAQSDFFLTSVKAPPTTKAERFAIYRGNLLAIWVKTLANAYPVVQRLVGEDFFEDLARVYGKQYPSASGNLNFFGENFSDFLMRHESLRDYPYIAPVAQLEWLLHQSYYAEDREKISLSQLISQTGTDVQLVVLHFAPDVSFHQSQFATAAIWQAHQTAEVEDLKVPIDTPTYCIISRPQWRAQILEISESAFHALKALRRGQTLESALDLALQHQANFDVGAQLQTWFAAGLFVGHSCKE